MNVLQINFSDYGGGGGGAIAMHRLCQGLARYQVNCKVLSKVKTLDSDQSAFIPRLRLLEGVLKRLTKPLGLNDLHILSTFGLHRHPFGQWANIVNTHVIHSDYFNYLALPTLANYIPTVLTLHDMWAFTGHCAYSFDCYRWQTGCGHCPHPDSYPSIQRDSTALEWRFKRCVYRQANLAVVTPSRWLQAQAQKSLLGHYPIYHIPNGLDVQTYAPIAPDLARQALDLPSDKFIIMSCAESLSDRRKGMDLLVQSLNRLPADLKTQTLLLLLGHRSTTLEQAVQLPTVSLGYVASDRLKALAYSAADLFALPTRADNLPIVLQESIACGTPMVSFDVGGISDLVRPGITGLLARAESVESFTAQITHFMGDRDLQKRLAHQCREVAVSEYSLDLQAQRYKALYETVVSHFNETHL
jgi:glycosyltransferase involved in cell wall biosynthesis